MESPIVAGNNQNKVKKAINEAVKILTGSVPVDSATAPSNNKAARIQALQTELNDIKKKTNAVSDEFDKTEQRRAENIIDAEGPGATHWVEITPKNGSEVYYEGVKHSGRIYKKYLPKNGVINKKSNNTGEYASTQKGGNANQNKIITNLETQIVAAKEELKAAEKDLDDIRARQAANVIAAEGPGVTEWIKKNTKNGLHYEGVKGHGTIWPENLPKNAKIRNVNTPKTGGRRRTMKKRKLRKA